MLPISSPGHRPAAGDAGLEGRIPFINFTRSLGVYYRLYLPPQNGKIYKALPGLGAAESPHSAFPTSPGVLPRQGPVVRLCCGGGEKQEQRFAGRELIETQGSRLPC